MSTHITAFQPEDTSRFRQILGIRFFVGCAAEAVRRMSNGGLLVVPAAPALKDIPKNRGYREAVLNADLAIADSGFMVLLWNMLQRDRIPRVSGLAYLRELLEQPEVRDVGAMYWIMAGAASARRNAEWLQTHGIHVTEEDIYVAPIYGEHIEDECLLQKLRERRPRHIVITLGGGTQERLGLYLKRNLESRAAIHCIGAAIAFLSGDQVNIPVWADKCYLGWLFRCLSEPRRYVSRYWGARKLFGLMLRFREQLPALES
jgi:UDP-N-acetyl-D-mannosaminuronic acid transferase (WecB/TagA/CpsF family)